MTVLRWYKGKAQENARLALELLFQSEAEGQWLPKASRRVRAALGKCNVAAKIAEEISPALTSMRTAQDEKRSALGHGYSIYSIMRYGNLERALSVDLGPLSTLAVTEESRKALATASEFLSDVLPLAQIMKRLDDTRPKPTFTFLGVSRTITATLGDLRMNLNLATLRMPQVEYWKEQQDDGTFRWKSRIAWPAGTVHHASRHAGGSQAGNNTCHACGHAIKNPCNWVPLLIDSQGGVPHSMWVGRDCSHNIFGVKVTGEVDILERVGL